MLMFTPSILAKAHSSWAGGFSPSYSHGVRRWIQLGPYRINRVLNLGDLTLNVLLAVREQSLETICLRIQGRYHCVASSILPVGNCQNGRNAG